MASVISRFAGFRASVSGTGGTITNQGPRSGIDPETWFAIASASQGYRFSHWTWSADKTIGEFMTSQLELNAYNPNLDVTCDLIEYIDSSSAGTLRVYAHFVQEQSGDEDRYCVISLMAVPLASGKVSLDGSYFKAAVSAQVEVGDTFRAVAKPELGYRLSHWESSLGARINNVAGESLAIIRVARQTEVWFAHFEPGEDSGLILRDASTGVILRSSSTGVILREAAS